MDMYVSIEHFLMCMFLVNASFDGCCVLTFNAFEKYVCRSFQVCFIITCVAESVRYVCVS